MTASKVVVNVIDVGPMRSLSEILVDPPKFRPPPVTSGPKYISKACSRHYLYEPKSRLFVKRGGIIRWWSVSDNTQRAHAILTSDMQEAYSAASKKEADDYLKVVTQTCGYASIGTVRGTVELDEFLGCKVDNSALCVIINVKWLVVQEVSCTYSMVL